MNRRCINQCIFAVAVLIIGTTHANAELIQWTFKAEAQPHDPFRTLTAQLNESEGSRATQPGDLTVVPLIQYGFGGYSPSSPSDPTSVSDYFAVDVTITDTASGQTGMATISVSAFEQWDYFPFDDSWEPVFMGDLSGEGGGNNFTLGRNQYQVTGEFGNMIVEVMPVPGVSEPGALLMAVVGLLLISVVRRSRRVALV